MVPHPSSRCQSLAFPPNLSHPDRKVRLLGDDSGDGGDSEEGDETRYRTTSLNCSFVLHLTQGVQPFPVLPHAAGHPFRT